MMGMMIFADSLYVCSQWRLFKNNEWTTNKDEEGEGLQIRGLDLMTCVHTIVPVLGETFLLVT